MVDEEEGLRPTPLLPQPPLDRLGIEELGQYIAGLEAEIGRARLEITRKHGVRDAADSVFRRG